MDGHIHAFAVFGMAPQSALYDNEADQETIRGIVSATNRCLVSKILPDGTRKRATRFSALQSLYLFRDRYGRPGKGNACAIEASSVRARWRTQRPWRNGTCPTRSRPCAASWRRAC
jgi:transposase